MNTISRLNMLKGRSSTPGSYIRSRMHAGDPAVGTHQFPFLAVLNGSVINGPIADGANFAGADLASSIEYSRLQTPITPVSKTVRVPAGATAVTVEIALADVVAQDPGVMKAYFPYVDLRVALPPLMNGPASNLSVTVAGMPSESVGKAWPVAPLVTVNQEDIGKAVEMQFVPFVMRRSVPRLVYGALFGAEKISITVDGVSEGAQVTLSIPGVEHYTLSQTLANLSK